MTLVLIMYSHMATRSAKMMSGTNRSCIVQSLQSSTTRIQLFVCVRVGSYIFADLSLSSSCWILAHLDTKKYPAKNANIKLFAVRMCIS